MHFCTSQGKRKEIMRKETKTRGRGKKARFIALPSPSSLLLLSKKWKCILPFGFFSNGRLKKNTDGIKKKKKIKNRNQREKGERERKREKVVGEKSRWCQGAKGARQSGRCWVLGVVGRGRAGRAGCLGGRWAAPRHPNPPTPQPKPQERRKQRGAPRGGQGAGCCWGGAGCWAGDGEPGRAKGM